MAPTVCVSIASTVIGVVAIVVATRFERGPLLLPFATSMFVLVSIFGVRPLYMVAASRYDFYGFDISAGTFLATVVGLVAISSLALGYLAPPRVSVTQVRAKHGEPVRTDRPLSFGATVWVAIAFMTTWLLLTILIGGGPSFITEIFRGRTARIREVGAGVPVIVGALSTAATVVLASGRVNAERLRGLERSETLTYWAVGLATLLPPIALGTRRFLLPTLIVLIVAPVVRRWRRRIGSRVVLGAMLLFLVLASIPFVRSAGSRAEGANFVEAVVEYLSESGWSGAVENYFLSYDTEMFAYVAFASERLGSEMSYGYGAWVVGDAVLAPLPGEALRILGLQSRSDSILVETFGATCAVGQCPVPSAVGVALTDFGVVGVALIFLAIGYGFLRFEGAFPQLTGWRLTVGLAFVGFAPVLMRGNTINLLWLWANVVALALVGRWMAVRRDARPGPVFERGSVDAVVEIT